MAECWKRLRGRHKAMHETRLKTGKQGGSQMWNSLKRGVRSSALSCSMFLPVGRMNTTACHSVGGA